MFPPPPLPRGVKPDPSTDAVAEAQEAGGFAVMQLMHMKKRPPGGPEEPPPGADAPASRRDRFDPKLGTLIFKPPTQTRYDFSHGAHMIVHGELKKFDYF